MASVSLFQDDFNCCICLDFLNDPVTVPCGHSFCMSCITACWNKEDQKGVYSCPQCREIFCQRPVLGRNTMMAEVVEKLRKTDLQSDAETPRYAGPGDVECDFCTEKKYKAIKSCLTCLLSYCEVHIQPHYEVPRLSKHKLVNVISQLQEKICSQHDRIVEVFCCADQKLICMLCSKDDHIGHKIVSMAAERADKQKKLMWKKLGNNNQIQQKEKKLQQAQQAFTSLQVSAQKAVDESEKIFTELIRFIDQKRSEVMGSIKAEVSRAEGLLEQLEMEIAKLKSRDDEMERLLQTEDHIDFLKSVGSCWSVPVSEISSITFTPHLSSTDIITPALKDIVKMLKLKLRPVFKAEAPIYQSGSCTVSSARTGDKAEDPVSQSDGTVPPTQRGIWMGGRVRLSPSVPRPKCGWGRKTLAWPCHP
ncbi:E3 ubiquitin/ISG15 ligase TRIM25-like [Engraulis encrasicolus]|uniref:E3 ubiquitin/ISG15 ligase TRIM25-like n=1 Tax=Engraulis encrasicolus TaxID=184585 RepID=UPI002FD22E2C